MKMSKKSRLRKLLLPGWRAIRLWANVHSRGSLPTFLDSQIERFNAKGASAAALSVGAGGNLGERVRSNCLGRLTEIDIDPDRGPDVVADVCDMNCFSDNQFDAIFAMEVLEHVREPSMAVKEMHRVLRPGGQVTISVPFILEIHDAPHDYWRFTEHGLRYLLRDFDEVHIARRSGYFTAGILPLLRLYMSKHPIDLLLGLLFLIVALVLWPVILLGDLVIKSDCATSGYNVSCRKAE